MMTWLAPPPSAVPAMSGVLGQYLLLDRLGAGGMGEVYKAQHLLMKRVVALKVLSTRVAQDPAAVLRFQREIQVAGRLDHANIVTAYDAAQAGEFHFLVMEYVDGVDATHSVGESGPLPVALACEITRQVALGLQHAHEFGLVHCDIKPANLLLRREVVRDHGRVPLRGGGGFGAGCVVKILDFGLARLAGSAAATLPAAEDSWPDESFAGTPDFMAPELGRDSQSADIRSDLYSLGCTFYYLLTGRPPFPGGTWSEKLLRHQFELPVPVTELRTEVPADVAAVVGRLLAKDPAERYPIPADVAEALQACLTRMERSTKPVAGPSDALVKTPVLLEALTFPSSYLDTSFSVHQAESAPAAAPAHAAVAPPLTPQPRRRPWPFLAVMAITAGLGIGWLLRPESDPEPRLALPATANRAERFVLLSSPNVSYARLEDALDAARDGDTVEIHGNGPFVCRALPIRDKALTLRAAVGNRPRIEYTPAVDDEAWQPLFHANRPLKLQGLELAREPRAGEARPFTAHLVFAEDAAVELTDCRLLAPAGQALVVCRRCDTVTLNRCQLVAHASALCVEAGPGPASRVDLADCSVLTDAAAGAALCVWADGPGTGPVTLRLERNAVEAGRVLALSGVGAGIDVSAHGNTFAFRHALFSCTHLQATPPRGRTRWEGRHNVYQGGDEWVTADGRLIGIRGLRAWRAFWQAEEAGSVEEPSSFPVQTALRGESR